jgi:hypothetical protein
MVYRLGPACVQGREVESLAKERDSEEMVEEDLWDLTSKWEQINVNKASTRPNEAALDASPAATSATGTTAEAPTTGFTEKTERLASDKSIASFRHVYNRPIDEDDIEVAAALAKAQADKPVDLTGTQFEFSKEQLDRDRQKAQDGPLSTGMSMPTAAKTTPRTRLKLKEAQDEIAELRLALTQHAVLNPPADSLQSTESPTKVTPQPPGEDSDDRQADAFTENQALGAATSKPSHDAIQADSNAMEEDHHEPIVIGSSSSDSASGVLFTQTASVLSKSVKAEDKSMKESSSSLSPSSSSSSSSSSSNDTEDLANRLKKTKSTSTTPSPKNLDTLDKLSGSDLDSASHQGPGHDSGSRGDHIQSKDLSGGADALPKDAGPGV